MNREDIELAINAELEKRKTKVLNRNAFGALFSMFGDPVGALGKILIGRQDALDNERAILERGKILDMLCILDQAISKAAESGKEAGIEVDGVIHVKGGKVDSATGVAIGPGSGAVRFKPGTRITVELEEGKSLAGITIGAGGRDEG
jgi:hypothetical protein